MTELKKCRLKKKMTQKEAAKRIGISLRSYITYENDERKKTTPKYRFIMNELEKINPLDEENGVLPVEDIKRICDNVFSEYSVDFCYLFGSYAKGKAVGKSDVDLLISTEITGLKFFEITERLRETLHKKVDLLDIKQLVGNENLLKVILKEGIKIYG